MTSDTEPTTIVDTEVLTITRPLDKCDRHALADAYVACRFTNGVLMFCGHCYSQHREAIHAAALDVLDERDALVSPIHHAQGTQ